MKLTVTLVEIKIPENIGFIARVMKNLGFKELCLYRCNVNEKSFITAAHAKDILENATFLDKEEDFHNFLSNFNLVIGTTGVDSKEEKYLRKPTYTPEEIEVFGRTTILFGREDFGLLNNELEICHAIVTIPTNKEYPIMNVSHAAAIILYEISKKRSLHKLIQEEIATSKDIDVLLENIESLLKETWYPKHRIKKTIVAFRRVFGRSKLTKREILVLNGVFRKTREYIKKLKYESQK